MKVILSHVNLDFDGLASMIAAKKLYPDAHVVISDKVSNAVQSFLAIYRDKLNVVEAHKIPWTQVEQIILVDVSILKRVGFFIDQLSPSVSYILYDHHPLTDESVDYSEGKVEPIGATVTMLVEELQKHKIPIHSFEATLFGLGIYTDTSAFCNSNTTARDLQAASYLLGIGMRLDLVNRFSEQMNSPNLHSIFSQLLIHADEQYMDGLNIIVSSYSQKKFQGGLATLTQKLVETTGADAAITVVEMQKRVYIVGRSSSKRVNFLPLMKLFGGGGHAQAASASIKKGKLEDIVPIVKNSLPNLIKPSITAKEIMSSPVKTIPPNMTIEKAADLMYRYGHTGFPVVDGEKLVGIISRRDLDKATHHGLGHAPVKAYMSSNVISIHLDTSIEEIQKTMIQHDIGRLPVVSEGKICGILSRTNVIEFLHNESFQNKWTPSAQWNRQAIKNKLEKQLSTNTYELLLQIGKGADDFNVNAFIIGGIVRDLILERPNDDIDIVIEGDGISFSNYLVTHFGGQQKSHPSFGTATWIHPNGEKIDIVSSRFEYYEQPAALPVVEYSNLRQDLYRRDFTINAMAIQINQASFGKIIDYFDGRNDLINKSIKVLHNLSFVEDPTRIIRAVRFEAKLHFKMDAQTFDLAMQSMEKMKDLSKQRIANELHKLLQENDPLYGIKRLLQLGFWKLLYATTQDDATILSHGKKFHKWIQAYPDFLTNKDHLWFFYFILPYFKIPNWLPWVTLYALNRKEIKIAEDIAKIEEQWEFIDKTCTSSIHRHLKHISNEAILFFISHPDVEKDAPVFLDYLMKRNNMPKLLTGNDLMALDIPPGPIYSQLQSQLENLYFDKKIATKEEAINWVKSTYM